MLPSNGRTVKQRNNLFMTIDEWKQIMELVKDRCDTKWYVFLLLLSFRGMRPSEALAVNMYDFSDDYRKLTFREAKTNKMRSKEHIIPDVAQVIKAYIELNKHRLVDGYLFPVYNGRRKGRPYMKSNTASVWFNKDIRPRLIKRNKAMSEWYPVYCENGQVQRRYRIGLYSFRRFFESYIYIKNEFAPMSVVLIKEIMEYSSKFDPTVHYLKHIHYESQKGEILDKTLNPLAQFITQGQTDLSAFT